MNSLIKRYLHPRLIQVLWTETILLQENITEVNGPDSFNCFNTHTIRKRDLFYGNLEFTKIELIKESERQLLNIILS